jgi:hypothetical protein
LSQKVALLAAEDDLEKDIVQETRMPHGVMIAQIRAEVTGGQRLTNVQQVILDGVPTMEIEPFSGGVDGVDRNS